MAAGRTASLAMGLGLGQGGERRRDRGGSRRGDDGGARRGDGGRRNLEGDRAAVEEEECVRVFCD
jgi:hypothetical protein